MSLLSGPRGAAPGSARLRRSSRPSPGTPSAWRGASHGAGGAHLAAGQVPGSSGDAPTPAARTPPAPPPLPLPGSPGQAPPAGKGNACAKGAPVAGAWWCPLGSAAEAPRERGCGLGAGSEEPSEQRETRPWLRAFVLRSPGLGGSHFLAARCCSPPRVTAGAGGRPWPSPGEAVHPLAVRCAHPALPPHWFPSSQHLTGAELSCFLVICETRHCCFLQRSCVLHLESVIMSLEQWQDKAVPHLNRGFKHSCQLTPLVSTLKLMCEGSRRRNI
ncbi:translation initiation factor IF-2-like [Onychostruthus taczanowskii]|uniref:translation initiation factor IF-2-like n=1 Tax=Onychostruthus taczanowskii TaxID=356909 RepID=UPI001B809F19|nr:translation initiation factor IF-2-like [Onychostruthus taczanowskii]